MKGPGLRIEIDVRREWRCPTCGQNQRWPTDITAPRCYCSRDGVPMKLAEGQRPGRLDLRPELRAVLDRIQGGEEIPRLMSLISGESDAGASRTRGRPPRPEQYGDRTNAAPREPRRQEESAPIMPEPLPVPTPPSPTISAPVVPAPPTPSPADDEFGAGLGSPSEP